MLLRLRFTLVAVIVVALFIEPASGQGSAGSASSLEPRYLIDIPTAGILHANDLALDLDFYQQGGVLVAVSIGLLNRLNLGVSYGGSKLLGSEEPEMNQVPGISLKVRAIEENVVLPAIVIGFDSQGKDGYIKSLSRYTVKSPGFFIVGSKNYSMLGFFSIHGGVNYSLERADGDKDFNIFAGVEKTVGSVVSILAEYNLAANDSNGKAIGKGHGYLNTGLKWSMGNGLTLGVNLKDLVKNANQVNVGNRTIRIEYVKAL
jgi:hypothetical protein